MAHPLKAKRDTAVCWAVLLLFFVARPVQGAQPTDTSDSLLGGDTIWELKAYGVAGSNSLHAFVPDPRVFYGPFLLRFSEADTSAVGFVGGTDGCHLLGGQYERGSGSELTLRSLWGETTGPCYENWPPPPHVPWRTALSQVISYERPAPDSLRLYWRGAEEDTLRVLVFAPWDETVESPLTGTDWELEAYGDAASDRLHPVVPDPRVFYGPFLLRFHGEQHLGFHRATGTDGCNDFEALYKTGSDSLLTVTQLGTTLLDVCYQRWPDAGPPWFGGMAGAVSYALPTPDSLRLYWRYDDGESLGDTLRVLVFAPHRDTSSAVAPVEARGQGLHLGVAAPHPFREATTLRYELARPGPVRLVLYDVLGREVAVLVEGRRAAGEHAVRLEGGALPAGVYVARLVSGGHTDSRRLVRVR